jgi:hypothetical protein
LNTKVKFEEVYGGTASWKEQVKDRKSNLQVGDDRVLRLGVDYENEGYLVVGNTKNHEGPDLLLFSIPDGKLRKVIECTNFAKPEYHIGDAKLSRYINSLCYFKGIKGIELELVVSYKENLSGTQREELEDYDIKVTVIGSQDPPFHRDEDSEGWIENE